MLTQTQRWNRWIWGILLVLMIAVLGACTMPFQAERQYLSTMYNHVKQTLDTLNTLQDLAADPKLGDAAWESQVESEMKTMRRLIKEARAMNPPEQFIGIHDSYLNIMNNLEDMADMYDKAMELRNNQYLLQAKQLMRQAEQSIETLRSRFENLRKEYQKKANSQ